MLDETHLFFVVGDVSGKGVPAALFMALTKTLYKSSALRRRVAIEAVMTEVNAEIARENPEMMFVTALAGILDVETGAVEFCNAGHDVPVLLSPHQPPRPLPTDGGPPLCALEDFDYPRGSHTLKPGEALVLYTDGVTEAMNSRQELYSSKRLLAALGRLADDASCATIVNAVQADVDAFVDGAEVSDDLAILVVRYFGAG